MTFFDFLDHRYRSTHLYLQVPTNYSLAKEGELKAAYSLIQWQRSFYKMIHMPLLCIKFLLIRAHVLKNPVPPSEPAKEPVIQVEESKESIQTNH